MNDLEFNDLLKEISEKYNCEINKDLEENVGVIMNWSEKLSKNDIVELYGEALKLMNTLGIEKLELGINNV